MLNIDETGTDATKEERVRVHEATPAGVTITALKGVVGTERRDDASSLPWWRVMRDLQEISADAGGNPMLSASRDMLPQRQYYSSTQGNGVPPYDDPFLEMRNIPRTTNAKHALSTLIPPHKNAKRALRAQQRTRARRSAVSF